MTTSTLSANDIHALFEINMSVFVALKSPYGALMHYDIALKGTKLGTPPATVGVES